MQYHAFVQQLSVTDLKNSIPEFLREMQERPHRRIKGDGKSIGTYIERELHRYLEKTFAYTRGSAGKGADFPDLGVDVKATRLEKPQSSAPVKSAREALYGLGYDLVLIVYKVVEFDPPQKDESRLEFPKAVFIEKDRTGDYRHTRHVRSMVEQQKPRSEIARWLYDQGIGRRLDECEELADEVLANPPKIGHVTVTPVPQWRMNYNVTLTRVADPSSEGVISLL